MAAKKKKKKKRVRGPSPSQLIELRDAIITDQSAQLRSMRETLDAAALANQRLQAELSEVRTAYNSADARVRSLLQEVRSKELEYESRRREDRALLMRARDLLIHEKVTAQFEGRELPTGRGPFAKPNGWRCNGIGELIDAIDQNSR